MKKRFPNVVYTDVKTEISPTLVRGFKKFDFDYSFANPTREHEKLCPHTSYNTLEAAIDCYWANNEKLKKNTSTFFRSQFNITNPAPPPGATNEYFINGGRDAAFTIGGYLIVKDPEHATHGQIRKIASDSKWARDIFQRVAAWQESKTDTFANDVCGAAKRTLAAASGRNEHHLGDFLKHVADPLAAFDSTGFLGGEGETTVARISDLRTSKKPKVLGIMTPLSHITDYSIYTSLFVNAVFQACKMFPTGRPIHLCLDEFTTLRLVDYDKELITMRGLGCTAETFIQSSEALAERTSPAAAATILNQSDIKTWAAVDTFKDARELSELLGSTVEKEYDANVDGSFEDVRFGLKDAAVPLMSPQSIMAMPADEQIVQIRGMYPIHCKKIRAWEIGGIRELLNENPLEGPIPDSKIKAKLKVTKDGVKLISPKVPKRFSKPKKHSKSLLWAINPVSFTWLAAWIAIYFGAFSAMPDIGWPALRVTYSYVGSSSNPHYTMCRYLAVNGDNFTKPGGTCPLVMISRGGREWR